jgi:cell division protein FtsB
MTDLEQQLLEAWQHYLDERDSAIVQRLETLSAHVASLAAQLDGLSADVAHCTAEVQRLQQALTRRSGGGSGI